MTIAAMGSTARTMDREHATLMLQPTPIVARRTTSALLRLALGRAVECAGLDWPALLATALRERLAGVVWLRAGDLIRSSAPADVVDRWRTLAVVIDRRGRERLEALDTVVATLGNVGIRPVVLKGMPLALRLYGDPFVRASDDIDLFIAAPDRPFARRALEASGWTCIDGSAPWDELFSAMDQPRLYLEVHGTLVTDYLAHIRMPAPESRTMTIGATTVAALSGAAEPAYLAAHLAGHQLPPLLWGVDFHTLWTGLPAGERHAAKEFASRIGLGRYLAWAIGVAETVSLAADDDHGALARLGVRDGPRSDTHLSVARHAGLAADPIDAVRAVAACLWPRPIRWDVAALTERIWLALQHRRGRRDDSLHAREEEVLRAATGIKRVTAMREGHPTAAGRRISGPTATERAVTSDAVPTGRLNLDRPGVLLVVREVLSVAGTARVRAAGMSMWPTIGNGSLVTLEPLPDRLRVGQIVLMDWGGRPVLHRIVRVDPHTVYTAGDACLEPDPPTPREKVCAVATSVAVEGGAITLTGSWSLGARSWLAYTASRARLRLARKWRRLQGRSRI